MGAVQGTEALLQLWDELCGNGQVAGGYWALMSHGHVPAEVVVHAFGDVHMLSHFLGGHNRAQLDRAWRLERERDELAARIGRLRATHKEALAQREARIAELEGELAAARAELARRMTAVVRDQGQRMRRLELRLARAERKVVATRARCRALERQARPAPPGDVAVAAAAPLPAADPPSAPDLGGRQLLYVGGRPALVPHLRAVATRCNGCLLYHDGGVEEAAARLDDLVRRADTVFCPLDCVSHSACLALKSLCRRHAKMLILLRTSGRSAFRQGLGAAAGEATAPGAAVVAKLAARGPEAVPR